MRLKIVSDLHLEFFSNWPLQKRQLIKAVVQGDYDYLVIAGDLTTYPALISELAAVTSHPDFTGKTLIYVPGNHDYYHSLAGIQGLSTRIATALPDIIHGDDKDQIQHPLKEPVFFGATLWFPFQNGNRQYQDYLNDFRLCGCLSTAFYGKAECHRQFLENSITLNSIVVTHHCPSNKSTSERYKGSFLNRFFVHDMEKTILQKQPKLWIHGHTHDSFDYCIGKTRVVCNPFGYYRGEANSKFDPNLILDV